MPTRVPAGVDPALQRLFRDADYRVRTHGGGSARLRIEQPLPTALRTLIGTRPWALLTAWNPLAQPASAASNRAAQRALLAALRGLPTPPVLRQAIGSGAGGWREPGFLVIGPDHASIDALARHFRQLAWVGGNGQTPARLHWLDWPADSRVDKPASDCGESPG